MKTCIGNGAALCVMFREACVFKRDALKCIRIRLLSPRLNDNSCAVIGVAGKWSSDRQEHLKSFGVNDL